MVEAIFLSCPPRLYDPLYKAVAPALPALAVNPIANFAVQSLIASAPAARNVAYAFDALKGLLGSLLFRGRSGVVATLVAACAAWTVQCQECCSAVQANFPDGVRTPRYLCMHVHHACCTLASWLRCTAPSAWGALPLPSRAGWLQPVM